MHLMFHHYKAIQLEKAAKVSAKATFTGTETDILVALQLETP